MEFELIKVGKSAKGENIVSGRELHEFLGVKARYNDWFNRMKEYGFIENIDFAAITQKRVTAQGNETSYIDHVLKLDTAKEIAMIQRSEKGKQARQYFIEVEKQFKQLALPSYQIEDPIQRAYQWAEEQKQKLALSNQIEEQKPKIEYLETVLESNSTFTVTQIAEDFGWSANKLNKYLFDKGIQRKVNRQWVLYAMYKGEGLTDTKTQYYKQDKEKTAIHTQWTQKGRLFIHDLLKEDGILPTNNYNKN